MTEPKSFKLSLFLTWMLQLTALTQQTLNMDVTVGHDVTLPCEDFKEFHECNSTTWLFTEGRTPAVTLFEYGKIHSADKTKSDRLSVTASCSLVIKKVTREDAGQYNCRPFNKSGQQVADSSVKLSVSHRVDTSITTTPTTTTPTTPTTLLTSATATPAAIDTAVIIYSSVAIGVAALLITVVLIIRWRRNKRDRTQMGDKAELSLNPVMAPSDPETSQDMTEAADAVAYASISYNNIPNTRGRVQHREEDMVTYSTVKASAPSAGASDDPSNFYASIQKHR